MLAKVVESELSTLGCASIIDALAAASLFIEVSHGCECLVGLAVIFFTWSLCMEMRRMIYKEEGTAPLLRHCLFPFTKSSSVKRRLHTFE